MNREGTLYEVLHFAAVVGLAYLALFLARAARITELWQELLVALVVGLGYVLVMFYLNLEPPSWRGG